jgi:uncharacterized phage protein gp47/JayE
LSQKFKDLFGASSVLPGGKIYQILESIAYESTVSEQAIEDFVSNNSLMTATGATLTSIGENFFGVPRIKANRPVITSTMKALKFYTNNGVAFGDINKINNIASDIIVPEGTMITGYSNGVSYTFRITSDVILNKNSNEMYIPAELISGDYALIPSNTLTTHTFKSYAQSASNLLLVTNPVAIGTGSDIESDDNYRYRLINSLKAKDSSSYYGIKNELLKIQGVSNIEIINSAYGGGSFAVFVQGITPVTSDELISTVKSTLSTLVPPWVLYTVEKPTYIGLTLSVILNTGSTDIQDFTISAIQSAISSYVNNFYGSEFKILKLQQIVQAAAPSAYSSQIDSVQIYSGTSEFRMYEEMNLAQSDPTIYLSDTDKIIIEPNIYQPIQVSKLV